MSQPEELPDWVEPGVKFWLYYQEGNINNQLYHIRGIVDGHVIVRHWLKRKRRWYYEVLHPYWFWSRREDLYLTNKPFTLKAEQRTV